jgi:hypothetical protein
MEVIEVQMGERQVRIAYKEEGWAHDSIGFVCSYGIVRKGFEWVDDHRLLVHIKDREGRWVSPDKYDVAQAVGLKVFDIALPNAWVEEQIADHRLDWAAAVWCYDDAPTFGEPVYVGITFLERCRSAMDEHLKALSNEADPYEDTYP